MKYTMTTPCDQCPFLLKFKNGYTMKQLNAYSSGEFPCHRTAVTNDESGDFEATTDSLHCAGALIFLEKRNRSHQMMRICERIGFYDRRKLDMNAEVL